MRKNSIRAMIAVCLTAAAVTAPQICAWAAGAVASWTTGSREDQAQLSISLPESQAAAGVSALQVSIRLEPVEEGSQEETDPLWQISAGRRATLENARRACEMGVDMIVLTGNPGMGVSNEAIERTLRLYKEELGDKIILAAGKMHAAGILEEAAQQIVTDKEVRSFRDAGADILLFPAPGSVPGITMEYVRELVTYAHSLGALTITAIGTSQEGADTDTIKRLALLCKLTGTDIHHLGDAGYAGMSLPENIQAYSVAIRGIRHTYHRMAASLRR